MGREGKYTIIRMPSGEMRYILEECMATTEQSAMWDFANISIGKAGRIDHRGIRPQTRGAAHEPC
jgi:large subunit ribosomal protein L2